MSTKHPQYISASRRNDLPRFQYSRFFDAWKAGAITYDGGYGRSYTVSLRPDDVMGYIFWSKDFSLFIQQPQFKELIKRSNAVFHFTLNNNPSLEPNLAPSCRRLETMAKLCDLVDPLRVLWRYDPVCRYVDSTGSRVTTIEPFFGLLPKIAALGIRRCYFSFMTDYNKLRRRPVQFIAFEDHEKLSIAKRMASASREEGVMLFNCCNPLVSEQIDAINKASCIDEKYLALTDRFGVHRSTKPRPTREGCGCFESRDIGSYRPACRHGCKYCYANPLI